ncbi:MAG: PAS domain-containing protein [Arcobacteraceae bacterium]
MNYFTNFDVDFLLELYGENVIASLTDTRGIIKYVSDAYVEISGYSKDELLGQPQNIVRHPDMEASVFKELWETIALGKTWKGEIKNLKKNKDFYWVKATITPQKDKKGNIIGYASVRQDITDKKRAVQLHNQIQNMLDNIEDGFLIFDKNFKIQESYSKSCLNILNEDTLVCKNISDVLFYNHQELQETFNFGCEQIFKIDCLKTQEIYLSLLPSEHYNDKYKYSIHYKILPNNMLLLLLRDITNQIELETKIKHEQKMQKMYITIATHKEESIELIQSFIKFLKYNFQDSDEHKLKMDLHTFKGLFAQLEMLHTIEAIHILETSLKNESFNTTHKEQLQNAFYEDIKLITDTFGHLFLAPITSVKVEIEQIDSLVSSIESLIQKSNDFDLKQILESIKHLKDQSFYNMINAHKITVANTAKKIDKELYPLEVVGPKELLVGEKFKNFTKSLVHIFLNSIVHGIEEEYIRVQYNKNPKGKIKSHFDFDEKNIVLTISDDGQGINIPEIIEKALEHGLVSQEDIAKLTDQDILQFVFSNEFSTIDYVDELSGRGVGLASVKYELLKLNGTVKIENNRFKGLKFIFAIPYKDDTKNDVYILSSSIETTALYFLEHDVELKTNTINSPEKMNITNYYSTIQLTGLMNVIFTISIEEKLLVRIVEFFIKNSNDKEKEKLKNNLAGEVLNILIGLSLDKFPNDYAELTLGTPFVLDQAIVETFIHQNQTSIKQIVTEYGSLELAVIILNTTH